MKSFTSLQRLRKIQKRNLYPSSQQCNSRSCMRLGQCSLVQLYILTAGSRSDLLHSLHRCRRLQRKSQEASWKQLDMHQLRRPEMGDGISRSPSHLCQRSLTLQCILTVGSKSCHLFVSHTLDHLLDRSADVRQRSRLSSNLMVRHRKCCVDVVRNPFVE